MLVADPYVEHLIENSWKSKRKVRTLDDLLSIPLDKTTKPVVCIPDYYVDNIPVNTFKDDKLYVAWTLYNARSKHGNPEVWAPTLNTFKQKLRWKLYTTLVKLGLI